jgi:CMP-N-acetylneuraminic acid synthetase
MQKINNEKIIAIIPARGGSKGLPGKNIKPLLGKPLIAWTIEQAKRSKFIDKLIVSTDSQKIAKVAKKYGAEVPFLRPEKYAKDNSPTSEAIIHALDWFEKRGEKFDIIVLLEPTSPLRKDGDIDNAIELFIKNIRKADALISIGEVHLENPFLIKKIDKLGYVKNFLKISNKISLRQYLPKVYFPYGVIYLSKVNLFKKHKSFYQKKVVPYYIERWQNYEIDDIYDFICVEAILKQKLQKKI